MLDEYIYQYQETQRWKAQYGKEFAMNETAMSAMHQGSSAWQCSNVLECLYSIIETSGVKTYLRQQKEEKSAMANTAGASARVAIAEPELPILFGYFGIVSLMRLERTK